MLWQFEAMSQKCCRAVKHWKSLSRFVTRRRRGRNKQRCTWHCTFWYISKSSSVQLRREIFYRVTFNRGRERWLHSLLRAISSNRDFVYYSCSRCNRRRFWSKSLIHNFHINYSAACLHPKFCISIVFDFSWDDCSTQEKLQTMLMPNVSFFRGWGWRGGGTTCIMEYVKMANSWMRQDILHRFGIL